MEHNKGEIVLYNPNETISIDVRLEDETVWLTQSQMAELFNTTRNNVTLHIRNIFKEGELTENSVSKDFLLTANDGKKYRTKCYNLDVIISVGYRVKSRIGTKFRQWALTIIKEHLLRGYTINAQIASLQYQIDARFEKTQNDLFVLNQRQQKQEQQLKIFIKTSLPPKEGIFFDGQIFDAYVFVADLIKKANKRIVLIDNYIDESVLLLFSKRKESIPATIYTQKISEQLRLDIQKYNTQYSQIDVKIFKQSHDRFLIIDDELYWVGASLKDLGKKWFGFSKMESFSANAIIARIES